MLKVEIDSHSGFCGGVIRAIGTAEKYLSEHHGRLCSLGAIVHNDEELSRLRSLGLVTVGSLEEAVRESPGGTPVLIRAHGEPPEVYRRAAQAGISLIDCTCPVVLRLQKAIKEAYSRVSPRGGSIVIFGKTGHPEVLGLVVRPDMDGWPDTSVPWYRTGSCSCTRRSARRWRGGTGSSPNSRRGTT